MDTATKEADIVCNQNMTDAEAASSEKHSDFVSFDTSEAAKKALVRKLDLHIVPMVMVLYLAAFLDRVNIGNARLYGMEEDLGLVGNQYQLGVSLLFVTYLLCEVPSNLAIKKIKPKRLIAGLCIGWGIVSTLSGLVQNFAGLVVCRLLLGAVEAGLFPGLTMYLTFFYTRKELALRIGYIFVSAAIAGAFGGLLAFAIGYMDGLSGQRGWRWIFIIEGLPSILAGIAAWLFLANNPEEAPYLTDVDKQLATWRLLQQPGETADGQKFHWRDVCDGATDWRTWAFAAAQYGVNTMWYGYSTFLPTIIKAIGSWTSAQVQLLTVPCYCLGAITYLVVAHLSDTQGRRGVYSIAFIVVSIVGYALLIADVSAGVHYFGCFLVAMGLYVAVGLPLAWLPNNNPRYGKRTFSSGFQLMIGSFGGVTAPFIYLTAEAPRYILGHAVTLGLIGASGMIYGILWTYYTRANQRRRAGFEDDALEGKTLDEIREMGDANPSFIYTT